RPGEKLYEELFYEYENELATDHEKIRLATHPELDNKLFNSKLKELEQVCNELDNEKIGKMMLEIINIDQSSPLPSNNVLPLTK
ncbi:MAG: hypothetical protein HN764_01335, partial [Gammaproteobacteria bacterium]|nr:hypothetical protein [Gammaproteobacteria bacterium]